MSYSKGIEKGHDLLHCMYPAKLALQQESDKDTADSNPEKRQNAYSIYRVDITLAIAVPSGPQFGSRELVSKNSNGRTFPQQKRTGRLTIDDMAGLTVDDHLIKSSNANGWKAGKMMELSPKRASVDMIHVGGREGILIRSGDPIVESQTYCRLELR